MIPITHTCQHCGASISENVCPYCGCKDTKYNLPPSPINPRNIKIKKVSNATGYYDYANNIFVIAPSKKLLTLDGCIVVLGAEGLLVYDKIEFNVIKVIEGVQDLYQFDEFHVCAVFCNRTDIYTSFKWSNGLNLRASIPVSGKILWGYKSHYYVSEKGLYNYTGCEVLSGNIHCFDKFDKYIVVGNKDGIGIFDTETDALLVPMRYPLISYNPQYNRFEVGDREEEKAIRNTINGLRKTDLLIWSICIGLMVIGLVTNFTVICVSFAIISFLLIIPIFGIKLFKS